VASRFRPRLQTSEARSCGYGSPTPKSLRPNQPSSAAAASRVCDADVFLVFRDGALMGLVSAALLAIGLAITGL